MKKDSMNPYMTEAERMLCCRWRKHVTGFAGKCVVREKHMLAPNVDAFDLLAEVIVSAVCNDAAIRQMAKKRSDTKRRGWWYNVERGQGGVAAIPGQVCEAGQERGDGVVAGGSVDGWDHALRDHLEELD